MLCVKPQVLKEVVQDLKATLASKVIVSIVAGITASAIASWIDPSVKLVRVMPNLCSLEGMGASGLFATPSVTSEEKKIVETVLSPTSIIQWVTSDVLIDAVTAVSGSGPAYFFLFIQLLAEAGQKVGLDEKVSTALAIQTALGAATVAKKQSEEGVSLTKLKEQVTSKGGTTAAALNEFEKDDGLKKLVTAAAHAAFTRGKELSAEFGGN